MNLLEFDHFTLTRIVKYVGNPWAFVLAHVCRALYLCMNVTQFRTPLWTTVVSVPMLQWALVKGCKWDKYTCACAAEGGHLDVLQWARSEGCGWDSLTLSLIHI